MTDASTFGLKPPSNASTFGLNAPKEKPTSAIPDPFTNITNPAINFLDYPARAVAGDIYGGLVKPAMEGQLPTRQSFEQGRQQVISATELKESPFGHFLSGVVSLPGEIIGKGVKGLSELALGKEATQQLAPAAETAADIAGLFGPKLGPKAFPAAEGADRATIAATKAENAARKTISKRFAESHTGISALDVLEEQQKAASQGQPLSLMDIPNSEVRALAGSVYRQGGEARAIIKDFLEGRDLSHGERTRAFLKDYISDQSASQTAEQLMKAQSDNARPLFDKAAEGGSTAPLAHQFEQSYREVSSREAEALRAMQVARQGQLVASSKMPVTGGNVYSESAARRGVREADKTMQTAARQLQAIRAEKAEIHQRMVRAQADGTANAPGAVWSPRLQQFLNLPQIKAGIHKGYQIERNIAVGSGRQFNPHEYAVIGEDLNGDPIIGEVPNMKLLMVAKEGLDALIADSFNKETGRYTKEGRSLLILRDGEKMPDGTQVGNGFVGELDKLNPDYRAAREQYKGDQESLDAISHGANLFNLKWFPETRDVAAYLNELAPSDREYVKTGVIGKLLQRLNEAGGEIAVERKLSGQAEKERLGLLLGPDADRLMDALERETIMRRTKNELIKGSQTQERKMDDLELARHVGSSALGFFLHHPFYAITHAAGTAREIMKRPNPKKNAAIARVLRTPNLPIGTGFGEPLIQQLAVPPTARRAMSPLEGAIAGAAGAQSTQP